jgi:hypothetical protein
MQEEKPRSLRSLLYVSTPDANSGNENTAAEEKDSFVLLTKWDAFVQDTLHSILDHQMVGSYSALANLSGVSQVCVPCGVCCVFHSQPQPQLLVFLVFTPLTFLSNLQDDPLKLGVDMDMFNLYNDGDSNGNGNGRLGFAPSISAEMRGGAGGWSNHEVK